MPDKPQVSVHRVHAARVKRLRAVLEEVIALATDLRAGMALNDLPSKSKMILATHIAGLIARRCREALEKELPNE